MILQTSEAITPLSLPRGSARPSRPNAATTSGSLTVFPVSRPEGRGGSNTAQILRRRVVQAARRQDGRCRTTPRQADSDETHREKATDPICAMTPTAVSSTGLRAPGRPQRGHRHRTLNSRQPLSVARPEGHPLEVRLSVCDKCAMAGSGTASWRCRREAQRGLSPALLRRVGRGGFEPP